jgi:signal transduction histidine kinase
MARILNRIVTRMLLLAAAMTVITMVVGLAAYRTSLYYQFDLATRHMPPAARAELSVLAAKHQRNSDRYFQLYERYGGDVLDLTDLRFILAIGTVSVIVGGAVAMIFARRISRPITAVAQAAAQVSAGNRSIRVVKGTTSGETGELVDSFNKMAADIEAYERERTVLTAGIAHELRTPLTILKGRLHGLTDGVIDPATGEADRLLRQVEHLSHIVEDLRTLAHADAGELALDRRQIGLEAVLHAAVADLRPSAAERGVSLVESYEAVRIWGDPVRLTQVFTNILTNAIKHAPDRSRVDVRLTMSGGLAVASVIDEGRGFQPEDGPLLFTPFWRAGADRRAGRPGSGIGLTLAAKLAEAHGGWIVPDNRADRPGACFSVWLPTGSPASSD